MDGHVGLAEGFLHQPDITGIVFDQENLCGHTPLLRRAFVVFSPFLPKQKRKVEPCPGCDSTEMLPLCRSTIFLRMANPMPVPANSPVVQPLEHAQNLFGALQVATSARTAPT
jgi:hypothetical protein